MPQFRYNVNISAKSTARFKKCALNRTAVAAASAEHGNGAAISAVACEVVLSNAQCNDSMQPTSKLHFAEVR